MANSGPSKSCSCFSEVRTPSPEPEPEMPKVDLEEIPLPVDPSSLVSRFMLYIYSPIPRAV